jgi:hypothetical protein
VIGGCEPIGLPDSDDVDAGLFNIRAFPAVEREVHGVRTALSRHSRFGSPNEGATDASWDSRESKSDRDTGYLAVGITS